MNPRPSACSFKGKHHTEETKLKIGAITSVAQSGVGNSQFGTMWITDGVENRKIKKADQIPDGWRVGRCMSLLPDSNTKTRLKGEKQKSHQDPHKDKGPEKYNSKLTGDITETFVLAHAISHGIMVSIPYGERARYDQIWEIDKKLFKIQVKTGTVSKDGRHLSISGKSISRLGPTTNIQYLYQKEDADAIATYFNGNCYLIPITKQSFSVYKLRLQSAENYGIQLDTTNGHQAWYLEDFLLEKQIQNLK